MSRGGACDPEERAGGAAAQGLARCDALPTPPCPGDAPVSSAQGGCAADDDRRSSERIDVSWSVDCETEETFLYAAITNISAMGIFVRTDDPLPVGTRMTLRFAPPHAGDAFALSGVVQWVNARRPLADNPNPGMGIRFTELSPADRERIVEAIHTIAYLREEPGLGGAAGGPRAQAPWQPRSGEGEN